MTPPAEAAPRWFAVRGDPPYVGISFATVARYRGRLEDNHGQTLEALHAAGGLDFYELWCGLTDRALFPSAKITREAARLAVLADVVKHGAQQATLARRERR